LRIFTRYILGEVTSHALIGGALFTFVIFMRDMGPILELVVRNSASLADVAKIFLYMLPNVLTVTIPMAVLVGILLGLSRLASDSEVTAMRACGVGVLSFVRIVAIMAAAGWMLGLVNTMYVAPKATAALLQLEDSLKDSQASFEVQPRVFYEDFRNYVLYVQDVRAGSTASLWHRVFLADLTQPASPLITTAEQAVVINGGNQSLHMRLRDGQQHQIAANDPDQYNISTFGEMDLPIQISTQDDIHLGRSDSPILAASNRDLLVRSRMAGPGNNGADSRAALIELNKRLSYPAACLVLMLVAVPLGLSSKRGGKSTGFVLTIVLVFVYYTFSSIGVALTRQQKVPVILGVWGANIIFALAGWMLLRQMARGGVTLHVFSSIGMGISKVVNRFSRKDPAHDLHALHSSAVMRARRALNSRFPLILDDYVMREFLTNFAVVLLCFVMLSLVFSFFELLGDIIRNRTALVTVGDYLLNLIPYMIYQLAPLCVLIAVLITFGVLNRSSELTAMKATGTSIYRIVTPVLVVAALIALSLFAFDQFYLPGANRRQEALRSVIKGKPAQTFLRPDRKWIFGDQAAGEPGRIFYYQFFDPDHDVFANLTVFEFQPDSFVLQRRIFASSAHWDASSNQWIFEHGWQRTFSGETTASYQPFAVSSFPDIRQPPSYFKKEVRPAQEMNYGELSHYISDLRQSGFDTIRLRVQLNLKLADPLIALVMAVLGVPFALSMGKRGSLTGIAVAIGVAIAFWVVSGTFEAMGNVNTLPVMVAAWSPDLLFTFIGSYLLLRMPT
jgi:LPS export ABC transporter permease LptG/LPS export ABC transporter permease LptF